MLENKAFYISIMMVRKDNSSACWQITNVAVFFLGDKEQHCLRTIWIFDVISAEACDGSLSKKEKARACLFSARGFVQNLTLLASTPGKFAMGVPRYVCDKITREYPLWHSQQQVGKEERTYMRHASISEAEAVEEETREHLGPTNGNKRFTERCHALVTEASLGAVNCDPKW